MTMCIMFEKEKNMLFWGIFAGEIFTTIVGLFDFQVQCYVIGQYEMTREMSYFPLPLLNLPLYLLQLDVYQAASLCIVDIKQPIHSLTLDPLAV